MLFLLFGELLEILATFYCHIRYHCHRDEIIKLKLSITSKSFNLIQNLRPGPKMSLDNNYGSSMSGNIVSTQQVFRNLSSALRRAQLTLAAVVDVNTYKGLFSLRYETAVTNNQCDQIWRF